MKRWVIITTTLTLHARHALLPPTSSIALHARYPFGAYGRVRARSRRGLVRSAALLAFASGEFRASSRRMPPATSERAAAGSELTPSTSRRVSLEQISLCGLIWRRRAWATRMGRVAACVRELKSGDLKRAKFPSPRAAVSAEILNGGIERWGGAIFAGARGRGCAAVTALCWRGL